MALADREQPEAGRRMTAPGSAGMSLLNDARFRGAAIQITVVAMVALVAWELFQNLQANMAARGFQFGYGYLDRQANFAIGESVIPYEPSNSYGRALAVGLANTIRVAVLGILFAGTLGVVLGVMRLSTNPLLARLVGIYIELVRNTPLLLQLFLWYAIINSLPRPREALHPVPGVFLSNRGLMIPWLVWDDRLIFVIVAAAVGIVATLMMQRSLRRRQEATGETRPLLPFALAFILGLPLLVAAALGWPVTITVPELAGFNFDGGIGLSPEFVALLVGLTLYSAAFIAEIVRSGIQSVSHGQWEAARALGLPRSRIMRLIILPQALRVIIPPLTSDFLSLTKNSSLAVAIGYPDLVHVSNTTMNQTGQAVEAVLLFMTVYLALSLLTSAFMNWYNAKVAIHER